MPDKDIHPEEQGLFIAFQHATQEEQFIEVPEKRFSVDESVRDAVAQVLYETEEHIPDNDGGFAWTHLHPLYKAKWHARAKLAVQTYLSLTTKRYEALTAAEIAPHVEKCNAELQARLEQES